MGDLRGGLHCLLKLCHVAGHGLERDSAIHGLLRCPVNRPPLAGADLGFDPVSAECLANQIIRHADLMGF